MQVDISHIKAEDLKGLISNEDLEIIEKKKPVTLYSA
jgi:hypothetical protein